MNINLKIINYIKLILNKYILTINYNKYDIFILIKPNNIYNVLYILNKNTLFQFKQLIDISGIDYPERINRFEIIYHLLSIIYNIRINVRTFSNELYPINSVINIYKN